MAGCTHCGDTNISVVSVTFECPQGHRYTEEVELPTDKPRETPKMSFSPRGKEVLPTNPGNITMPFGKHKGELIENLPTDYMVWCLENIERLSSTVKTEMENQIALREGKGVKR